MKEWATWWITIVREERVSEREDCCRVFLGSLDESVLHLADESRKSPVLAIFLFSFIHPSTFALSCFMLCHSFSASLSFLPQVFRYLPPGCCCWCWEVQGALLSSCQGLCGPRGAPAEGPGQFYCPDAFHSMKDTVGRVLGRGAKTGGDQPLSWRSRVCVCVTAEIASPLLPLLLPCPVLSCPLRSRRAGECTCLKSTPQGQTPISPHLQGFTETPHVPHTLVSTYTLLKREHRGRSSHIVL